MAAPGRLRCACVQRRSDEHEAVSDRRGRHRVRIAKKRLEHIACARLPQLHPSIGKK